MARLSRDPNLQSIPDPDERQRQLRAAAEYSLVCRALVEQKAMADPEPIDATGLRVAVEQQKTVGACRSAFDDAQLRIGMELQMRVNRTLAQMVTGAQRPTEEEVRQFYEAHREHFRAPDRFQAAHVVKHVNEEQTEEQARAGILEAWEDLQRGNSFSAVADLFSDCKGNGGDLGTFAAGEMVPEFEDELRKLEVGQRSGIFTTPFGYHIVELRGKEEQTGPSHFDDVREDIERVMNLMAEHRAYLAAVEELHRTADIRWEPANDEHDASGIDLGR